MLHQGLLTTQNLHKVAVTTAGWAMVLVLLSGALRITLTPPLMAVYWGALGIAALLSLTQVAMHKDRPLLRYPAFSAVGLLVGQSMLGLILTLVTASPLVLVTHLLVSLLYLGVTVHQAVVTRFPAYALKHAGHIESAGQQFYWRWLLVAMVAFAVMVVGGGLVSSVNGSLACLGWPLCEGRVFPVTFDASVIVLLLHRFAVLTTGVTIAAIILITRRAYRDNPQLKYWANLLGILFLTQAILGGLNALDLPVISRVLHLGMAATIWSCLVVLASLFYVTAPAYPLPRIIPPDDITLKQKAWVFFKMTKPWIMILLLITTAGAMFIAASGMPPLWLLLVVMLGGALSAGGASTLNSYIDSDIDGVMSRTSRRPTVTGLVTAQETLAFGLVLSIISFLVFALFVNLLSALLSTLGIVYYVFFYTMYLKRTTIHNIIIGGAAGAIPPLVGWAAVTGALDLTAFYLFAIIFFWTPPHTWALALLLRTDYARAEVPMLPIVASERETTYQILLYSILMVTLTLLPYTYGAFGWFYFTGAAMLGVSFIVMAIRLWHSYTKPTSKRLYKFSQYYLALIFLLMALDRGLF